MCETWTCRCATDKVVFETTSDAILALEYCHCSNEQEWERHLLEGTQGTGRNSDPFNPIAFVRGEDFTLTKGRDKLSEFIAKDSQAPRYSCEDCGTKLFSDLSGMGMMGIFFTPSSDLWKQSSRLSFSTETNFMNSLDSSAKEEAHNISAETTSLNSPSKKGWRLMFSEKDSAHIFTANSILPSDELEIMKTECGSMLEAGLGDPPSTAFLLRFLGAKCFCCADYAPKGL